MTDFINNFHFIRPLWLLLLIPALFIAVFLLRREARGVQWQSLVAPHLLPFLLDGQSIQQKKYPIYVLLALWALACIALAGPAWTKLAEPVQQKADALVILWDLSPSMAAQDVKPSRLVRSRLKLIDLLRKREEGLTGLIAYSGEAHVVTPLTDDTETIISLLAGLDPNIMPAKGSNAEMALEKANQLLKDSSIASGNILFFTDGIDSSAHLELQQLQDDTQHSITIWGIGTVAGAPIPIANGGFAYDRNRNMVIAALDEKELSDLASDLGGLYVPFTESEFDLDTLENFVFRTAGVEINQSERLFDKWYEHGPYLLLLLLPFAALSFRRGWLLSLAFVTLTTMPDKADAFGWQDLWQTKDQQAQKILESDPEAAAQLFNNEQWKAISNYQAGKYDEAAKGFQGEREQDIYNRANTFTQLGNYDDAINAYEQALKLNPDFENAQHNLEIAKKLKQLSEQSQQQQNQQGDSEQDSEQNQQQDSQQSDSSSNEQPDQSQQDSQQQAQQQEQNSDQQQGEQGEQQQQQAQAENSEEQQQALEETYGEESEQQQESEQQAQQQAQMRQQQAEQEQGDEQEQKEAQAVEAVAATQQELEQQEAQQALEQWLRKVPDDPSGLLRNKFRYEHRQRKHELQQQHWKNPNGETPEERW